MPFGSARESDIPLAGLSGEMLLCVGRPESGAPKINR
jgi:hypothetical protein